MTTFLVAGTGMSLMQLVGAVFFLGFFAVAAVAIRYADVPLVRQAFVGGTFAVFVVVALVSPVQPLPFIHWHKFSHPVEEIETQYQFRVVDVNGEELQYDVGATLVVDGAYLHRYVPRYVTADETEQQTVGTYLVDRANLYRDRIENPPVTRAIRYPPGFVHDRWTPEKVAPYGEFVGLRVYEVTTTTSADGREVVDVSDELVVEIWTDAAPATLTDGSASASADFTHVPASASVDSRSAAPARLVVGGVAA